MRPITLLIAVLVIISSCKQAQTNESVFKLNYNAEPGMGWINTQTLKESPDARSGKFVCVTDSLNMFGLGYRQTIGELTDKDFTKLKLSCWVMAKTATPKLVLAASIDSADQSIFWNGMPFDKELIPNQWVEITAFIDIPEGKRNKSNKLTIYPLNDSKQEILIDDVAFIAQ